jgi:hypothetical protein
MKEHNVDSMKYRKSTHLASVDVDAIIAEKGKCILTIKDAYYSKTEIINGKKVGENVNGKFVDGYFIHFVEDVKPMMVNSGNRKEINKLTKQIKQCTDAESRLLPNWIGLQIELLYDPTVKFGDEVTGGFKVAKTIVTREKKTLNETQFAKALQSIADNNYTREELEENFVLTKEQIERL